MPRKKVYQARRKAGICVACGKEPAQIGFVFCGKCREKDKARCRLRYQKLKTNGKCTLCKVKPATEGFTTCDECREKERIESEERRRLYAENGICPRCGKQNIYPGEKSCPDCLEKALEYNKTQRLDPIYREKMSAFLKDRRRRLKEAGVCVYCGRRKAREGKTACAYCGEKMRLRAIQYRGNPIPRSERPAYGMCYKCGSSIQEGERLCEACKKKCASNLPESHANEYWRADENARIMQLNYKRRKKEA
jgi:hypothetical protein